MSLTKITSKSLGSGEVQTSNLGSRIVTGGNIALNTIQGENIAPSTITQDRLAPNAQNDTMPVGSIIYYAGDTPPVGYLQANGVMLDRTIYNALFAAIGTRYNQGNEPATHFRLPDLRGEFIRCWDAGRLVDSGRTLGSTQEHDWKGFYFTNTYSGYAHQAYMGKTIYPTWSDTRLFMGKWESVNGAATGTLASWDESEIRPRNVALMACIKFANIPAISQTAINVQAVIDGKMNTTGGIFTGTIQSQNPKFFAHGGPALDVTPNATTQLQGAAVITFDSIPINVGGGMNTSGRFTAPQSGIYRFNFGGMAGGNNYVRFRLVRGIGTTQISSVGDERFAAASTYENFSAEWLVSLAVNEWVEVRMGWANTERNILHGGYRHFTGHMIP